MSKKRPREEISDEMNHVFSNAVNKVFTNSNAVNQEILKLLENIENKKINTIENKLKKIIPMIKSKNECKVVLLKLKFMDSKGIHINEDLFGKYLTKYHEYNPYKTTLTEQEKKELIEVMELPDEKPTKDFDEKDETNNDETNNEDFKSLKSLGFDFKSGKSKSKRRRRRRTKRRRGRKSNKK
jgi:hypothetical protein